MNFVSDKYVVGEVGNYCQLTVTYFWSHLIKPDNACSASVHFDSLAISLDPPLETTAALIFVWHENDYIMVMYEHTESSSCLVKLISQLENWLKIQCSHR